MQVFGSYYQVDMKIKTRLRVVNTSLSLNHLVSGSQFLNLCPTCLCCNTLHMKQTLNINYKGKVYSFYIISNHKNELFMFFILFFLLLIIIKMLVTDHEKKLLAWFATNKTQPTLEITLWEIVLIYLKSFC